MTDVIDEAARLTPVPGFEFLRHSLMLRYQVIYDTYGLRSFRAVLVSAPGILGSSPEYGVTAEFTLNDREPSKTKLSRIDFHNGDAADVQLNALLTEWEGKSPQFPWFRPWIRPEPFVGVELEWVHPGLNSKEHIFHVHQPESMHFVTYHGMIAMALGARVHQMTTVTPLNQEDHRRIRQVERLASHFDAFYSQTHDKVLAQFVGSRA